MALRRVVTKVRAASPTVTIGTDRLLMPRPRFNRILLKLSGEALMGEGQFGIDPDAVARLADEIKSAREGHELCLVVGGGNIFRGLAGAAKRFDRASAFITVASMPI